MEPVWIRKSIKEDYSFCCLTSFILCDASHGRENERFSFLDIDEHLCGKYNDEDCTLNTSKIKVHMLNTQKVSWTSENCKKYF